MTFELAVQTVRLQEVTVPAGPASTFITVLAVGVVMVLAVVAWAVVGLEFKRQKSLKPSSERTIESTRTQADMIRDRFKNSME